MVSFFKNFGKGVLYVLVLPFLLVGLAVYGVVAFFIFIFLAIKGLVLFFTGRSLYEDLPEDIEAKKRLAGTPTSEPVKVTNEDISSALNNNVQEEKTVNTTDPFYVPEYLKPEQETVEEVQPETEPETTITEEPNPVVEETPVEEQKEMVIEPSFINEPDVPEEEPAVQEDEILLEKTEQKSNILEITDVEEDEEESSGVNIDFD